MGRGITVAKGVDARLVLPAVAVAVAIVALWWNLLDRMDRERVVLDLTARQNTAVMAQLVEEHAIATFRRLDDLLTDIAADTERDIPLLVPARRSFEEGLAASVRIYDQDGEMRLAMGRATTRDPVVERDEFRLHRDGGPQRGDAGGFVIGIPFVSPGSSDVFIPVSRRLDSVDGRFRGVAVADVPAETFARFYAGLELPPGASVTLIRSDGPILARQALQDRVVGRITPMAALWSALKRAPEGSYRTVSSVDGVERIFSYRRSAGYPLITVVGESTDTVFEPWRQNLRVYVLWAAGTTVVILAFTTAFLVELQRRRRGDRALRVRDRAMAWSGDGILIADARKPGMPVVYVNPAFEELIGSRPTELIGQPVLRILDGPMPDPATLRSLRDAISGTREARFEIRHTPRGAADANASASTSTSNERWLELRASPVRDEAGRLVNLIATVRDVSETKRAALALAEARREAERANVAKSKFLAAASHDLRQPVQSLMLLAEVLSARAGDDQTRKILGTMDRALGALKMLLDGLLDVSRLEAGAVEPAVTVFPVNELLDRVAAASRPVAVRKGLILHIMPCAAHVHSDPMLLGRILQNLVENALRYTPTGRILVGCRPRGKRLRLEVWDTGIGIPTDRQDEIFQEFVQIGNPSRDRDQGLGLGLAVVRRLAIMLGHPVTLRSTPGRGSVFAVEVPLADAPSRPVAPPSSAAVPAAPAGIAAGGAGASDAVRRKDFILLVEDDSIVREGLRAMLGQWGNGVLAAESCVEALVLLRGAPTPDLIVADYRLRDGRTGIEVICEVRRLVGRQLPAILVTGDTNPERLAEAEDGKFRVLHKPVRAEDLKRAVAVALAPPPAEVVVEVVAD